MTAPKQKLKARGSDGKTYTLIVTPVVAASGLRGKSSPKTIHASDGREVLENARGHLHIAGTGIELEVVPDEAGA